MAISIGECVELLAEERIRHHVDVEEEAIRVVFVTRRYRNLRGEKLVIARITTPDSGRRCRVVVERAFAPGDDPAATCLGLCRAAADTPLVGPEFDAESENLRLVTEAVVEDGTLTRRQLVAMLDTIVESAEVWHAVTVTDGPRIAHRDVVQEKRRIA